MTSQRYERIATNEDKQPPSSPRHHTSPISPPPSFRSRTNSTNIPTSHSTPESRPLVSDADRNLADAFDPSSSDDDDDSSEHGAHPRQQHLDDRQRAMTARPTTDSASDSRPLSGRRITPPSPRTTAPARTPANDGVFANLSAKPTRGEEVDEKPPTYEQAAADATPPYWETTVFSPGASSDDVYIDGLPVGSLFAFIWNGMISASFQLVGFLLTYLLHTTHAAKHGSKAGLGITLIQYGFGMRSAAVRAGAGSPADFVPPPADPNSHDFDPNALVAGAADVAAAAAQGMAAADWFAYALMIAGWFILVRALGEFFKARRHEQLVLQSPSRGLGVAVVAEGERPETVV